ncbi:hypothetical protein Cgig2_008647 [Carnegiea gigantea]|uniref:Uncharacterized protein n=1 Tax=Carnegiea gigantea TaxID=171969 RepID=A0A9Q1JKC2_9CARY|nr:hypothetical protein Cgig2_008647 [Carnegiea gigantea]
MLMESEDEKVTYEGGSRKCMVVREGMGAEELLKMVRKMTESEISEEKLWYSLKYDREMFTAVEVDNNVKVIFKGNDEHGYMYIGRNAGQVRRPYARAVAFEARVRDIGEGKQIARSGGKCNDGEEVGEERGNNDVEVITGRRRGAAGEQAASRGDTIEMSDDDEISIASEDVGDEEATKKDDAGDERAAEKQCGDGNKREGCADGNDVNDNLGKKMDQYKTEMLKWKNGVGERIEQKSADTYKTMGCIAAVECYSFMLGEYSMELTNSRPISCEARAIDLYLQAVADARSSMLSYSGCHSKGQPMGL